MTAMTMKVYKFFLNIVLITLITFCLIQTVNNVIKKEFFISDYIVVV